MNAPSANKVSGRTWNGGVSQFPPASYSTTIGDILFLDSRVALSLSEVEIKVLPPGKSLQGVWWNRLMATMFLTDGFFGEKAIKKGVIQARFEGLKAVVSEQRTIQRRFEA